ncbi:hypothetical protein OHA21_34990 [Actinoplanes sp. NBC_00393]|uniref:hypothetical protein n=1 Tax=Actinoplanes sp. NBC_00393 TaxID=2975953 RepID=UPI002E214164
MTNWMTAAGLAFIAGGLATLISFRAMIFGGGARRATRAGASARRRRSRSLPAPPPSMETGPTLANSAPAPMGAGPRSAPDPRELDPRELDPRELDPRELDPRELDPRELDQREPDPRQPGSLESDPREPGLLEPDPRQPDRALQTVPGLLEAGPVMVDAEPSLGDGLEPIEPELEPEPQPEPARRSARSRVGRRRRLAAAFSGRPTDTDPGHSGLASIGLADDESPFEPAAAFDRADQDFDHADYAEPAGAFELVESAPAFELAESAPAFQHAGSAPASEFAEPALAFQHPGSAPASEFAEPALAFQHPGSAPASEFAESALAFQHAEPAPASDFAELAPAFPAVAAGDEYPEAEVAEFGGIRDYGPEPADNRFAEAAPMPEPRPAVDRSDRSYGDRIDGWVRPHYLDLDDRPPAGDYWTPVPDDLYADPEPSARGYGWPVPVERLPPVPDYEPATGFDLTPVEAAEPTALVPAWPPVAEDRRIRLPRSWAARDEKASGQEQNTGRRSRRTGADDRPRPRPRPTAQIEPGSAYVSRHAAGPHG